MPTFEENEKREICALVAMHALLSNPSVTSCSLSATADGLQLSINNSVKLAYTAADAMVKAAKEAAP